MWLVSRETQAPDVSRETSRSRSSGHSSWHMASCHHSRADLWTTPAVVHNLARAVHTNAVGPPRSTRNEFVDKSIFPLANRMTTRSGEYASATERHPAGPSSTNTSYPQRCAQFRSTNAQQRHPQACGHSSSTGLSPGHSTIRHTSDSHTPRAAHEDTGPYAPILVRRLVDTSPSPRSDRLITVDPLSFDFTGTSGADSRPTAHRARPFHASHPGPKTAPTSLYRDSVILTVLIVVLRRLHPAPAHLVGPNAPTPIAAPSPLVERSVPALSLVHPPARRTLLLASTSASSLVWTVCFDAVVVDAGALLVGAPAPVDHHSSSTVWEPVALHHGVTLCTTPHRLFAASIRPTFTIVRLVTRPHCGRIGTLITRRKAQPNSAPAIRRLLATGPGAQRNGGCLQWAPSQQCAEPLRGSPPCTAGHIRSNACSCLPLSTLRGRSSRCLATSSVRRAPEARVSREWCSSRGGRAD